MSSASVDRSKDEILEKYETYVSEKGTPIFLKENAIKAMDEYASQQSIIEAIAFAEWAHKESNGWFIVDGDLNIWGNLNTHETKTTEQLYELFKQSGK